MLKIDIVEKGDKLVVIGFLYLSVTYLIQNDSIVAFEIELSGKMYVHLLLNLNAGDSVNNLIVLTLGS